MTPTLPGQAAAVPLYAADGTTTVLVFDLDTSRGGRQQVQTDTQRLQDLVTSCGGHLILDESPSGGRHAYLPLREPVGFHAVRDLAVDVAALLPSMDVAPNHGLTDGLIRPPGSVHPSGGHQVLLGDLNAAVATATVRNPLEVWRQLRAAVPHRLQSSDTNILATADDLPVRGRSSGPRALAGDYLTIATTGRYDQNRYHSPSEARQAVILAAANSGLALTDVLSRMAGGVWPGLAAFYARYRAGQRTKAIRADWSKAAAYLRKHPAQRPSSRTVHKSLTSEPSSHPPRAETQISRGSSDEYRFLRSWWSALRASSARWPGRSGLGRRMALRAIGEAGMKSGSRYVAFGTRSLSIAAGLEQTAVAAHLRALRDEPDPFIDLIENDRGLAGDLYQLRIPDGLIDRANRAAWPAGRMHALRPAFRELGLPAAAIYEALETATTPVSSFELAETAGISRSSAYEALETLAAWNLAQPDGGGRWRIVTTTCLGRLAEAWGVIDTIRARITRHRAERAAYRRALRIPDDPYADLTLATWTAEHTRPPPPPHVADPLDTALELLQRELGARLTTSHSSR